MHGTHASSVTPTVPSPSASNTLRVGRSSFGSEESAMLPDAVAFFICANIVNTARQGRGAEQQASSEFGWTRLSTDVWRRRGNAL
jgi:hypothetical protein